MKKQHNIFVVVNIWLDRFEAEGVEGLSNKLGQGKKPILDATSARERIAEAVKNNRQQLKLARVAQFIYEQLYLLALSITKPTVVVLGNATPHKAKLIEQARDG